MQSREQPEEEATVNRDAFILGQRRIVQTVCLQDTESGDSGKKKIEHLLPIVTL